MSTLTRIALAMSILSFTACSPDPDADGDGFPASEDCNDNSLAVYPGAEEVCDGVDQNCDGEIDEGTECTDADGDGSLAAVDCDDNDDTSYPGAPETCDSADNDCDGTVDETTECYDDDFDGETENDGDCNDANANTYSTAPEVCDGLDNNCNDEADEGIDCSGDGDGDGFTVDQGDCDDTNAAVKPTGTETCDSLDNDCDGEIDEGTSCSDDDGDGQTEDDGDCDDANRATYTGALEICDGIDNNCDSNADEGIDCSGDNDADGFTVDQGDCDDTNSTIHPDGIEICDGIDQNCNSTIDEDTRCSDDDGDSYAETDGDCDDTDADVNPAATEVSDGLDNDCDGLIDENETVCDTEEFEPNDTFLLADTIGLDGLTCGVVAIDGDVDTFAFEVQDWTQVLFDIDADVFGSSLDSVVTLYDSTGNELFTNDDTSIGGTTDSELDVIFVEGGDYYVTVEDAFDTGSDDHTYDLWVFADQICDHEEIEPNNEALVADPFSAGDSVCGVVDDWSDYDWFEVDVGADTFISFDLDAQNIGSTLQAQLTLYDTDGATELHQVESTDGTDPFFTWYFADAGTYYIAVESDLVLLRDNGPYLLYTDAF